MRDDHGPEAGAHKQLQPRHRVIHITLRIGHAQSARYRHVNDTIPIGRHCVVAHHKCPGNAEKTDYPKCNLPSEIVEQERAQNARQQSAEC